MTQFYAYLHAKPDGNVFYVGKGRGKRSHNLTGRSSHHQRTIDKYGAEHILIGRIDCSSEETAFDLEVGLIKCLRRMGVSLTNKTDGGDGVRGLVHSSETKKQLKALFEDPDHRRRHSERVKQAHVRSKNLYKASAQASQNRPEILEKHKAYQGSALVREAKSRWGKNAWCSEKAEEWRAKIDAALSSDTTRLKMSVSQKGRVWVNNGCSRSKVTPAEAEVLLRQGWVKGFKL